MKRLNEKLEELSFFDQDEPSDLSKVVMDRDEPEESSFMKVFMVSIFILTILAVILML